jgi:cytochrome c-type biogenesis protein CcmH
MKRGGCKTVIALLLMMAPVVFSHAVSAAATAVSNAASAAATAVPETFSDPGMEARARHLQRQLRCLICAGESIDESASSFAVDVRRLVREQIALGKTDQQITDFFVARYGNAILMKPPLQPATWLLWLGPFGVLAIAGGVAWATIKKAGKAVA